MPPETVGSSSGYQRFTSAEMQEVGAEELRNLQFFTSAPLRLSTGEQAVDDSISTEEGRLMKIQTRQYRSVEIPPRTPGVLVEVGQDWIDLDVGDGVVLRFRESNPEGEYQCVALNGQPIVLQDNEPDAGSQIEFDGEKYELATAKPVFLEYFVRHVVNVDRASHTVGGKRLEEAKKTAAGY
ncbi:MAG: hypothetical protein WD275_04120 [Rhodothermales bacterium]